jgi:hypothetical protein
MKQSDPFLGGFDWYYWQMVDSLETRFLQNKELVAEILANRADVYRLVKRKRRKPEEKD